jgi:ketosteroid isomerase-like protein
MKPAVAAVALLVLLPPVVRAQVAADLRSAMQARAVATASADVATWDRLTADNFTLVSGDGRVVTKGERIADLKAQQPATPTPLESETVQTYGNVALQRFKNGGAVVQLVWAKTRGAWRVTSAQVTPVIYDSTRAAAGVSAASAQYRQGWLQGDTGKALSVVSDDIRIMIQGVPDVRGRAAAAALFAAQMAAVKIPMLTVNRDQLVVRFDHAIDIGTYEETMVPISTAPGTPASIHAAGRYVIVWRREAPGWRLLTFMLNSATRDFQ